MTIKQKTLNVLSDLKWHCQKCDLPGCQPAATVRQLIREGYIFDSENSKYNLKYDFCSNCSSKTVFRKLKSTIPKENKKRINFSEKIRKRILKLYNNEDVITKQTHDLEIDHRVTPNRDNRDEEIILDNVSDEYLIEHYMVLNRNTNQIKREKCKKCIKTNIRQKSLLDINFFYSGDENYFGSCIGCFWAYPEKWKEKLEEKYELYRK